MELMEWSSLENCIGEKVPKCLKVLLWKIGYDSMYSIKQISSKTIEEIEKCIEKSRENILPYIDELINEDDAVIYYQKQKVFKFLPGHRSILLDLPNSIREMQKKVISQTNLNMCSMEFDEQPTTNYSVVLTEFVNTAKINKYKSKHAFAYNPVVKYFATYIFLLCGRTCYETLNKNLPIPSTKTICKLQYIFVFLCL